MRGREFVTGKARKDVLLQDAQLRGIEGLPAGRVQHCSGCPHVVAYRMSPTTYRLMKNKGYLPYVGLPNILAGEWLVPELLQDDATPQNLARALGNWLTHKDAATRLKHRFADIHASLAVDNAARVRDALRPFLTRMAESGPAVQAAQPAAA